MTRPCWCGEPRPHYDDEPFDATCGGSGHLTCECGGSGLCVCHWHGEVPCDGCEECAGEDDWFDDDEDDCMDCGVCDSCIERSRAHTEAPGWPYPLDLYLQWAWLMDVLAYGRGVRRG